ncbi:MAG: hypothetical protein ACP5I3_10210 [Thermoproteus sp.]
MRSVLMDYAYGMTDFEKALFDTSMFLEVKQAMGVLEDITEMFSYTLEEEDELDELVRESAKTTAHIMSLRVRYEDYMDKEFFLIRLYSLHYTDNGTERLIHGMGEKINVYSFVSGVTSFSSNPDDGGSVDIVFNPAPVV